MSKKDIKIYFDNYEILDNDINKASLIVLRNKTTGSLFIQKILSNYDLDVYKSLKTHPIANTPKVIDMVVDGNNLIILKEYIAGITLDEYLDNNELDKKTFFNHIYKLCDIVHNLQNIRNISNDSEKTIIHRDIKPSNIIISDIEELYLFDLDAAKFYKENESRDTKLIGTEHFAAPEQYGFGASNKSTDIYAIGKLIEYYIEYIDDDKFKNEISKIINKCCMIDYKDRYKNISELKADLFRAEHDIMNLLFPGFRTLNPIHMVLATFTYILLIFVCFFYTIYQNTNINIATFVAFISFIFVFFNYLNVLRFFPFTQSKNLLVKYTSRFVISLIVPIIIIFIILHI